MGTARVRAEGVLGNAVFVLGVFLILVERFG